MPYLNPAMMAIGDSLFNGVRSLTINAPLAEWSVPAQVARALDIDDFVSPDYPRNVVVNMESWLRMLPDISGIRADLRANIRFWLARPAPASGANYFDNIAIASSDWSDMTSRTAALAEEELHVISGTLGDQITEFGDHLGDLFFAFNTRFLLDPAGTTPQRSSLALVAERKPKRLLVSIGANNGLWNMCFNAVNRGFDADDMREMNAFIAALKSLPPEVEHIYLNTLPLPRTVSNLMPYPEGAVYQKPADGEYFQHYENSFGFTYGRLQGSDVAAMDAKVKSVNDAIAAAAASEPRIHLVRVDELLTQYDSKHSSTAKAVQIPYRSMQLTLRNIMTATAPFPIIPIFREGGLQGLDGMHPTVVGYGLMAQELLRSIEAHEGIKPKTPIDLAVAERHDTLLSNLPRGWSPLRGLWRNIREARSRGRTPAINKDNATVSAFMQTIKFKTGRSAS